MVGGLYALLETGGTKCMVAVARSPDEMLRSDRIGTTSPEETLERALAFFRAAATDFGELTAAGIGAFGPVDVDPASPTWGRILDTPKPGWSGVDIAGAIARALRCPVRLDTDVAAAARAEARWGAGRSVHVMSYVTVGTGIGGSVVVDGEPVHGRRHPEFGHFRPARHPDDTSFPGVCPFHADCLEGLASGPAIKARWGASLSELASGHPAHDIVAGYLAQLVVSLQALLAPDRMVMGGGVMETPGLLDRVRAAAGAIAGTYYGVDEASYEHLVRPPGLDGRSGLMGCLILAQNAHAAAQGWEVA